MRNKQEIEILRDSVQRQVDIYAERGISRPQTPIERAAFEQGRLQVLEWLMSDPSEDLCHAEKAHP